MSDALHGRALVDRIVGEHRWLLFGLGAIIVLNVAVYALLVYPLAQRVANVEERNASAARELAAARQDYARASGTLTGKARAATELEAFYTRVLPPDLAGARRLTHLRLAQLAREANLEYGRASAEPVTERDSTLTRLKITLELTGSYADVRTFLHAVEVAPQFVVIDNVAIAKEAEDPNRLSMNVELSAYFKAATP